MSTNRAVDGANGMQDGASAALKTADLGSGIHEDVSKRENHPSGHTPAFDAAGTVGKEFTAEGKIGAAAQKLGGPFKETGSIGKQFTEQGAVGANVQEHLGSGSK
ncbi:uncharacterized protein E0L32_012348 [Thyridium curvatum]|uniref:Uncharacterized protein n=1 Tax=Thyridium curvatum TaxID=1093900 RepID=A0A507B420_9PEZI|nr:uncharacterized protein E0L32_012348 [Thyridium curvatum]TPX17002.1 hypothetical protein E0L32_012348 [Thyridium curvatum]